MAFQTEEGAVALQLVRAMLFAMQRSESVDLADVDAALRSKLKSASGSEEADIDEALSIVASFTT